MEIITLEELEKLGEGKSKKLFTSYTGPEILVICYINTGTILLLNTIIN